MHKYIAWMYLKIKNKNIDWKWDDWRRSIFLRQIYPSLFLSVSTHVITMMIALIAEYIKAAQKRNSTTRRSGAARDTNSEGGRHRGVATSGRRRAVVHRMLCFSSSMRSAGSAASTTVMCLPSATTLRWLFAKINSERPLVGCMRI